VISGFYSEEEENCSVLGYYAAGSSNSLRTFRNNLSVPSSGVNPNPKGSDPKIKFVFGFDPLSRRPIGYLETSVRNLHYSLRNDPEERSFQDVNLSVSTQLSFMGRVAVKLH
jgi:hypothetical protein